MGGKASTHPLSSSSTATERGRADRGRFRKGPPRCRRDSSCRSWERVWGYLAVIFKHISAFRRKNKRFLPNQQANLMQKGRVPPCSPRLQHPLPVLPAGQPSSPGSGGQATSPSHEDPLAALGGGGWVSPSLPSLLSWGGEHCPCQGWASKGPHRGSRELTVG